MRRRTTRIVIVVSSIAAALLLATAPAGATSLGEVNRVGSEVAADLTNVALARKSGDATALATQCSKLATDAHEATTQTRPKSYPKKAWGFHLTAASGYEKAGKLCAAAAKSGDTAKAAQAETLIDKASKAALQAAALAY